MIGDSERELWNLRQLGHNEISESARAKEGVIIHRLTLLYAMNYFVGQLSDLDTSVVIHHHNYA